MVDPPDLEDKHCLLSVASPFGAFDEANSNRSLNCQSTTSSIRSNLTTRSHPHRRRRRPTRSSLSRVALLALLALCLFFLPCTLSHDVPASNSASRRAVTSAREEGQTSLTGMEKRQADVFQIYSPTSTVSTSPWSLTKRQAAPAESTCGCKEPLPLGRTIGFAFLAIILVLLSGVFAGLTLGYMSLDETQLQVLMTTGDDVQKARAEKIIPIRKDGHLLLTTLLIANMITNETLPIIFDPLLSNQVLSVVISTVLIVIFSELIPQSTCSRYGLQIGAYMAFPTRIIIIVLWPIAYPVSRILHWVLGPHHGIVYRRAELKELVTMHAASGGRGGDLKGDTVMIVGGALDLQEKVVKQAMTPIDQVFMLPFTAKLDYSTLEKVVRSGHSRIPIYQEIEVQVSQAKSGASTPKKKLPLLSSFTRKASTDDGNAAKNGSPLLDGKEQAGDGEGTRTVIRKKIVGTLLVKSCVLLDPEDAVPVSSMVINALPSVPGDEPLLNLLNVFQEGRSHMAIVSARSRKGMSDSIADLGSKSNLYRSIQPAAPGASAAPRVDGLGHIDEEKNLEGGHEVTRSSSNPTSSSGQSTQTSGKTRNDHSPKRKHLWSRAFGRGEGKEMMEQGVPSDATITAEKGGIEFGSLTKLESHQSSIVPTNEDNGLPLGIITLEDVLEELLGEEILDEYDDRGNEEQDFRTLMPPPSPEDVMGEDGEKKAREGDEVVDEKELPSATLDSTTWSNSGTHHHASMQTSPPPAKKTMLTRLGITRQRSQSHRDPSASPSGVVQFSEEPGSIDGGLERAGAGYGPMPSPALQPPSGGGYFDEPGVESMQSLQARSSSVPPVTDRQQLEDGRGRSASRPQTPSGLRPGVGGTNQVNPPLLTPQANRPVVIRTQAPGGGQMTTIANESMLRGRQPGQAANATATNPASRSQTPVGGPVPPTGSANIAGVNKGNRFKSQAAVGVGASAVLPTRTRSQAASDPPDLSSSIDTLPEKDKEGAENEVEEGDAK